MDRSGQDKRKKTDSKATVSKTKVLSKIKVKYKAKTKQTGKQVNRSSSSSTSLTSKSSSKTSISKQTRKSTASATSPHKSKSSGLSLTEYFGSLCSLSPIAEAGSTESVLSVESKDTVQLEDNLVRLNVYGLTKVTHVILLRCASITHYYRII